MATRALTSGPALAIAVVIAIAVAATSLAVTPAAPPTLAATLAVDGDRLTFTHRAGDAVDARRLDVTVRVDGTPLRHQPPVPFFAARGYHSGPTGPFNARANTTWGVGESASLRVAATNRPAIAPGARVTVVLEHDGRHLTTVTATA
ncbi:type IV pilin [Haloplanus sp. C73]|uniref:type IV pilin n=1 Tax=Haloplanus sp. C73 TaxID=3421641 RepID=UPI003EBE3C1E